MADAGSSSDEEPGADEARFIQEMCKEHGSLKVDPEDVRRQEIMEEVARRRSAKQQDGADERARLRQKSDAIFGHFDADADGFLNYSELFHEELGHRWRRALAAGLRRCLPRGRR